MGPVLESPPELTSVLAGCHSLMEVQEELVGDPIELTAFEALQFTWDSEKQTATKGIIPALEKGIKKAQEELAKIAKAEQDQQGKLNAFQQEELAKIAKAEQDQQG